MTLPFKPHIIALACSAGLFVGAGVLFVKSRIPQAPEQPVPAAVAPQPPAATVATPPPVAPAPAVTPTPVASTSFTIAQIDQWVAPIALYPDSLLSQVLMASTYPANVVQAVQWSRDNPTLQGDKAIQAVSDQPWDPSVKSLVAFPQLMALLGENQEWVQNLGDAFLAQPQDVMDSVQKLRRLAQQTGSLKSTVEQKVISAPVKSVSVASQSSGTAAPSPAAPAPTVIKIEPADPQVVYVPNYNPTVVYGSWPNTAYPPVYLPPPQGEPFVDSFVRGFGYSMGVATTYALFSNIDWDDDDDHHHHDDDYHHHDGNGYQHNGDNININVNNFNHITGQNLKEQNMTWQHNPAYRNGVPYQNNALAQRFHQTDVSGGLSATQHTPATTTTRDSQRQAAMTQFQQRSHTPASTSGSATPRLSGATSRDIQRREASQQLDQIARRDNYRGYDTNHSDIQRSARRDELKSQRQQHPISQQQREAAHQRFASSTPEQRQTFKQNVQNHRTNVFSGNDSRSPSWQSQQLRGQQSRQLGNLSSEQRSAAREHISEHHEFRRR